MTGLLISSLLICVFGFFNLLGINFSYALHYIEFIFMGLIAYFIVKKIKMSFFRLNASTFYILFIAILIITYIVGLEARGSKRWIDLFFFNFQPSEFFKIFFIIYFASKLAKLRRIEAKFSNLTTLLIHFIIPFFIIFKQPDLGSAMVYAVIFIIMLLYSNIPKRYIILLAIISSLSIPIAALSLKDYQKERILSFVNPHLDRRGSSYNMTQAIITVGSGKFLGRGLGLGTQSQLLFLPENHTDFAYSSLVEQFGFAGGMAVIFLYSLICFYLGRSALKYYGMKSETETFNFFVVLGFLSMFAFQVFVNIGMNLGMLPITGITLPFISYGGSSIVTLLFGIALLPL